MAAREIKVNETLSQEHMSSISKKVGKLDLNDGRKVKKGKTNYSSYKKAIETYNLLLQCVPAFSEKMRKGCESVNKMAEAFSDEDVKLARDIKAEMRANK